MGQCVSAWLIFLEYFEGVKIGFLLLGPIATLNRGNLAPKNRIKRVKGVH